jgi:hypothetical protein
MAGLLIGNEYGVSRAMVVAALTQASVNWILEKTTNGTVTEGDYEAAVDQNIIWAANYIDAQIAQTYDPLVVRGQAPSRLRDLVLDIATYLAAGYGNEYVAPESPLAVRFGYAMKEAKIYNTTRIPGFHEPVGINTGDFIQRFPVQVGSMRVGNHRKFQKHRRPYGY